MRNIDGRMVYDTISPLWHRHRMAMATPTNFNTIEMVADGMEVGEARSAIARRCLEYNPQPEFLLFLDYDVLMPADTLTKLFFRARTHPDHDIYAGVYCLKRDSMPEPLVYGDHGQGPLWNWAVGDILTTSSHNVRSVHMGLTLIRVSVFQELIDKGLVTDTDPFFLTVERSRTTKDGAAQTIQGTEDIYFCDKVMKAGGSILVDTSVLAGHHDKSSGITYGLPFLKDSPVERAKWLPYAKGETTDRKEANDNNKLLAIDLGAGGTRRQWEGYITYTLDIRPETQPDYCQDLLGINLPDNHFDLVASSHAFEHVGRWDQERLWAETFRICKPGGRIEIVVPNALWAAEKIKQGQEDVHVFNVLYGSQEADGYARQYNTHYFCYTPNVACALALNAGFESVATEDWKTNPELSYHLVIRATKPEQH